MAEVSRVSTRHSSSCSPPTAWKARVRIPVILAVTAFALAGCNANQSLNPSGQAASGDVYLDYNPYNPVEYAQTSGCCIGR